MMISRAFPDCYREGRLRAGYDMGFQMVDSAFDAVVFTRDPP